MHREVHDVVALEYIQAFAGHEPYAQQRLTLKQDPTNRQYQTLGKLVINQQKY